MNDLELQELEHDLRDAARALVYPPTPDIASVVIRRLRPHTPSPLASRPWAWALITLLVLLSALMLVPPARAAILDFIQIGVVRIFRAQPAPIQAPTALPGIQIPVTATPLVASPVSTQTAKTSLPDLDLAGETTLSDAQSRLNFPILLPTYPAELGQPDRVYLQDLGGSVLLLIWLDPDRSGQVRMSLGQIAPGSWAIEKIDPPVIQEVRVNGQRGIWTEGPYMVQSRNHNYEQKRLVTGHVLIWTQGEITYRPRDRPVARGGDQGRGVVALRITPLVFAANYNSGRPTCRAFQSEHYPIILLLTRNTRSHP